MTFVLLRSICFFLGDVMDEISNLFCVLGVIKYIYIYYLYFLRKNGGGKVGWWGPRFPPKTMLCFRRKKTHLSIFAQARCEAPALRATPALLSILSPHVEISATLYLFEELYSPALLSILSLLYLNIFFLFFYPIYKITPCWKAEINPRPDRKPTPTSRSTHTQIGTETKTQAHPEQTQAQIGVETKIQTHAEQTQV
jgi:hypothetical protein